MSNTCICVVGMHRSGTSALARALAAAGVQFGTDLCPAAEENLLGFWEHRLVVRVNEDLLAALGSSWDDIRGLPPEWWEEPGVALFKERLTRILSHDFSHSPLWGVKDPRICRLLPLWKKILADLAVRVVFVVPFRHPVEVAQSLQKRNDFSMAKAGFLWLDHNLSAEAWSRGHIRVFVDFDSLIRAPRTALQRILTTIGCAPYSALNGSLAQLKAAIVPDLRHHIVDDKEWPETFGLNGPLIARCYNALTFCSDRDEVSAHEIFDVLQIQRDQLVANFDEITTSHIADLQRRISNREKKVGHAYATLRGWLTTLLRRLGLPLSTQT